MLTIVSMCFVLHELCKFIPRLPECPDQNMICHDPVISTINIIGRWCLKSCFILSENSFMIIVIEYWLLLPRHSYLMFTKQFIKTRNKLNRNSHVITNLTGRAHSTLDKLHSIWLRTQTTTSTSNPFLCAADLFLQLGSCMEAVR